MNKTEFDMVWNLAQKASVLSNQVGMALGLDEGSKTRAELLSAAQQAAGELTLATQVVLDSMSGGAEEVTLEAESILHEAYRLTGGDRRSDYGHPIDDFTRTGRLWGAILGIPDVPPERVGLCMTALKLSRECNKPKRDNLVDAAGYVRTVDMVYAERARREVDPESDARDRAFLEEGRAERVGELHVHLAPNQELRSVGGLVEIKERQEITMDPTCSPEQAERHAGRGLRANDLLLHPAGSKFLLTPPSACGHVYLMVAPGWSARLGTLSDILEVEQDGDPCNKVDFDLGRIRREGGEMLEAAIKLARDYGLIIEDGRR